MLQVQLQLQKEITTLKLKLKSRDGDLKDLKEKLSKWIAESEGATVSVAEDVVCDNVRGINCMYMFCK